MDLSEEQIIALAPDDAAKKAGIALAAPAKWVAKGANEAAIWGLCQGSGSKPYQTQIDLGNLATKCSCPSRKFPCKHGLGLLILHARQASTFTDNEQPAWVSDWLQKRSEREEKKTEKASKPVDENAQNKRQEARHQKVTDGVDELLRWIKDLLQTGIVQLPEKGTAFIDNMTRRMIDAQAPGLAAMLRELSDINYYQEAWPSQCLEQLSRIYLAAKGYQNIDTLSPDLQQDIRTMIGFPQSQEALKAMPGVQDHWFVLGKEVSQEEQLTVERNWLYGLHTGQHALILQFYVRSQQPTFTALPGMIIDAELVFYPSALPLRAIVKHQLGNKDRSTVHGLANWQEVVQQQTQFNSRQPFGTQYPFIVDHLHAVQHAGEWFLQDAAGQRMQLAPPFTGLWKWLAISGGAPLQTAVVGKGNSYRLLGAWNRNEYKLLYANDLE